MTGVVTPKLVLPPPPKGAKGMTKSRKNGQTQKTRVQGSAARSGRIAKRNPRTRKSKTRQRPTVKDALTRHGFNAFHPLHVPLPVPTGPYTVIRTRRTYNSSERLSLFGTFDTKSANGTDWTNYVGISRGAAAMATGIGSGTWNYITVPIPFSDGNAAGMVEVVPAAVSVQVVNPQSLTSASGTYYFGKLKSTLSQPAAGETRTTTQFADALLSFSNPKVVSGAKLAMTPMQLDAAPGNLSELANFDSISVGTDSAGAWGPTNDFAAFKPVYVYNPSGTELTYTVCVEWRVRLDPFNPMHSSQTTYKPVDHGVWHAIADAANNTTVEEAGIAGAAGYMMSGGAGEGFLAGAVDWLSSAAIAALPELEAAAPLLLL